MKNHGGSCQVFVESAESGLLQSQGAGGQIADLSGAIVLDGAGIQVSGLDGPLLAVLGEELEGGAVETAYLYPGAIQYYGPAEVCDLTTRTLALETA